MLGKTPSNIEGQGFGKIKESRIAEIAKEAYQEAVTKARTAGNSPAPSERLAKQGIDLGRIAQEAKNEATESVKTKAEEIKERGKKINRWLDEAAETLGLKKKE